MNRHTASIKVKPLSVNVCWQGKRYKTKTYKAYEEEVMYLLPAMTISKGRPLKISMTFGVSNMQQDVDNPTKPMLDIMQKKYGFNDRDVMQLNLKKELTEKGREFVRFTVIEIMDDEAA